MTQGAQERTFAYDSLSRLICASNPEARVVGAASCGVLPLPASGVMRYTYDDNGNLLMRTDARGAVVTMSYNARNQVTSKTYTGTATGLTPAVSYGYDTCAYGAGRLCAVSNSVVTKAYAYDALGRVAASSQTMTGASPYAFSYNYFAGDGLREVTYPAIGAQAGRKVGYEYYASGRLKGVWDGAVGSGQRWVQGDIAYWPSGAPKTATLGNGVVEGTELDERLRRMYGQRARRA